MIDFIIGHVVRIVFFKQVQHIPDAEFRRMALPHKIGFFYGEDTVHSFHKVFSSDVLIVFYRNVVVPGVLVLPPALLLGIIDIIDICSIRNEEQALFRKSDRFEFIKQFHFVHLGLFSADQNLATSQYVRLSKMFIVRCCPCVMPM